MSERYALILLALPFLIFCFRFRREYSRRLSLALPALVTLALGWSAFGTEDFEGMLRKTSDTETIVRRDYAATVMSFGQGFQRMLLVNGVGMTVLTPITKYMVHLPLAFHKSPPQSALVICFGMGTSYRSAMSWNVDTTVVELVPSVTQAFDAARFINATNGHIVTDDGRRFLKRTAKKFDLITVDPPPPAQAAGSSLLFSREFYTLDRQHLQPGGIVQMWFPGGDTETGQAVLRSMYESFPYVRCFKSVWGWGMHLLGSMETIEQFDANQLVARMPESARRDLVEGDKTNAPALLGVVLRSEFTADSVLKDSTFQITDDRPFNEYFLLRRIKPELDEF